MLILHFGAGKIGRGVIYPLLKDVCDNIILIDKNEKLVSQLNKNKEYNVLKENKIIKKFLISNIIHTSSEKINEYIVNTDIITTSIGTNNFKDISDILVDGIIERYKLNNNKKLYIVCFENELNVAQHLKTMIFCKLIENNNKAIAFWLLDNVKFINALIDCIVPEQNNDLDIITENFLECYIEDNDIDIFKQYILDSKNFNFKFKRKLYLFNIVHWVIAYLGMSYNYKFVHESLQDDNILEYINILYDKLILMLHKQFNISNDELIEYKNLIIKRIINNNLNDTNLRVIRNPVKKYNIISKVFKNDFKYIYPVLKEIKKYI